MKYILSLLAFLLCAASADAAAYRLWCSKPYTPDVRLIDTGYVTVLYRKGVGPIWLFDHEQKMIGSDDPNDLRGVDIWVVEGRDFWPCKDQTLPDWVKLGSHDLDDEIDLTKNGIRPAASP